MSDADAFCCLFRLRARILTISLDDSCTSGSRFPITTIPMGFSGSGSYFSFMALNQDIKNTLFLLRIEKHIMNLVEKRSRPPTNLKIVDGIYLRQTREAQAEKQIIGEFLFPKNGKKKSIILL